MPPYLFYCFMLVCLLSGAFNMLIMKFQVRHRVPNSGGGPLEPVFETFEHTWMQSLAMFAGMSLCLPVWYCIRSQEEREASAKVPISIFLVAGPFDVSASYLVTWGLLLIAVSVVQMCRSTMVFFTMLMSILFLGRKQHRYHYLGVALVVLGAAAVGISHGIGTSHHTSTITTVFGISLIMAAQIFQSCQFVYEEKIMREYAAPALQVVGMEGVFGFLLCSFVWVFQYLIGHVDLAEGLYQVCSSRALMASMWCYIISIAIFNYVGTQITRNASATARVTVQMCSSVVIWLVELSLGWSTFSFVQLFGFSLIVSGMLIYNHIVAFGFLEPTPESLPIMEGSKQQK